MSRQFANGYALLIGVNESNVKRWALPDLTKDIQALEHVLTHPQLCAYLKDNVNIVMGKAATRKGILDGLEWLQGRIQADPSDNATAIIYYTGHGWCDETIEPTEYYLIPCDVREDRLKVRALRATDFAEEIRSLNPQRLLVILDCCHAGGMGVKKVATLAEEYVPAALPSSFLMPDEKGVIGREADRLEGLTQGQGRAILSSSSANQPSFIRRDGSMSIFTYHLIEALTGHAQPQQGAIEVLVSDVMSHVWRKVPQSAARDWQATQQPDYRVSGNFPVALLLGGKGLSEGKSLPDPLQFQPNEAYRGGVSAEQESVAIGGDVSDSTIIVGHRNVVKK